MKVSGRRPEIFRGRGSLVRLGHFYKHFVKKHYKKKPIKEKFESSFS